MNSIDTNLFVHALDRSSPLHGAARPIYERLMTERGSWVIADQTMFELYRALRNPAIFARPLGTGEASGVVEQIRDRGAAAHCAYDANHWPRVMDLLRRFPDRKGILVFDAVVAVTLSAAGVDTFYTRNVRDFREFELFTVVDPTATE
jgi:predicted nucleic acid-binding protein